MKKIYILLFSCFFGNTYSQLISNRVIHHQDVSTKNLVQLHGHFYFSVLKNDGRSQFDSLFLYSYTSTGKLRFKTGVWRSNDSHLRKLIATSDGKIAMVNAASNCDVRMPMGNICKIDTNGTILWNKTYDYYFKDVCALNGSSDLFAIADKEYISSASGNILRLSSSGVILDSNQVFDEVYSIASYSTNALLLNVRPTAQSSKNIIIMTSSLTTVQTITVANSYSHFVFDNGFCFALNTSGIIEKLDTQFQPISTSSNLVNHTTGIQIKDFIISNDTIYSVATGLNAGNTSNYYYRFKSDFTGTLLSISNSTSQHTVSAIGLKHDTVFILANNQGNTISYTTNYVSFSNLKKMNQYFFAHDIAFKRLTVDSSYFILQPNNQYSIRTRFKSTVVNAGAPVINSFFINAAFFNYSFGCNRPLFQQKIENITLNSGDSLTFVTPFIDVAHYVSQSSLMLNTCFYLTAPNDRNDIYTPNDSHCKLYPAFVGLAEQDIDGKTSFKLIPNPIESRFWINLENYQFPETSIKATMTDVTGKHLQSYTLLSKKTEIDIAALSSGIYFLTLEEKGKVLATKKLIKN